MRICYHCMSPIQKSKLNTCPHCGNSLAFEPVDSKYLKPGTILQKKFVVGYPIGSGGFGNTYIGWDKFLLRKVAIKEYYPKQYVSRDDATTEITLNSADLRRKYRKGLQQFLEEARSIANLKDIKGVVEITNFFEENGTGYIVMEYLEGDTVNSIIKKSGNRLSYEQSREIVLTVLYTLRELHAKGILHRDIAPDNVFITNRGVIKLIDFGAAKHASELANVKSGIVLKAGYAPIEQYSKEANQGPWTDLYAVAALFYRMITGQRPLPATERLSYETLITPSQMGINIPEQAEMAMMVCLNVQPMYRLQSADEFIEALGGMDFTPVFVSEQDFQLAPVKEKNTIFPIWAKVTVACLACVAVASFIIFFVKKPDPQDLTDNTVAWRDFSGEKIETVEKFIEENGHNVNVVTELVYNADESKNGTVAEFTITLDDINKAKDDSSSGNEDIKIDENNHVTATMICKVYSSKEISYGELSKLNAFSLSKKMNIKTDDEIFGKDNEKVGTYFEFEEIKLKSGDSVNTEDIRNEDNKDKIIEIADIDKIVYFAGDFFYWASLPDFEGTNIYDSETRDLFNPDTYEKKDENSLPTKTNRTKCLYEDESLCETDCFSLLYFEGYVFEQTVSAGEEFDVSRDMDKLDENGKLLYIVGKSFEELIRNGIRGDELKKELEDYLGKSNICEIEGDEDHPVEKVTIYLINEDGSEEEIINGCAGRSDNIVIRIKTKEAVRTTRSPVPTDSVGH